MSNAKAKHTFFNNLTQQQQLIAASFFNVANVPSTEMLWKCNELTKSGNIFNIHDVTVVALIHAEKVPLFFKIC